MEFLLFNRQLKLTAMKVNQEFIENNKCRNQWDSLPLASANDIKDFIPNRL